jgi:SSS family solute:Na+ symporter
MLFANLAYWGTNQYVIQRTLAARSLAAGQKGVLLAGFFKLLIPFFIMLPGVIAFHLYGDALPSMDHAYPMLVKDVLPSFLAGIFLAVLLGTVFSSFNSLLQSAATLVTYDIFIPFANRELTDQEKIRIGRYACIAITAAGLCVAPALQLAPEGLWQLIRKFTGFYNIPIIAIVLAALFMPRANSRAALATILFHVPAYGIVTFWWDSGIHFIHWYAILFFIEMAILTLTPGSRAAIAPSDAPTVDLTPWKYRWWAVATLLLVIVALYVTLSPLGVVP